MISALAGLHAGSAKPDARYSIVAEGLGRALPLPPGSGAPSRFVHGIWKTGVERRGTAICWGWGSGSGSME